MYKVQNVMSSIYLGGLWKCLPAGCWTFGFNFKSRAEANNANANARHKSTWFRVMVRTFCFGALSSEKKCNGAFF